MPSGIRFMVSGRRSRWGSSSSPDVEVVGDDVAFRDALVRPEDLVEVGEAELPVGELEPPHIAVLARREGDRELDREGGPPGAPLPRGHGAMVAVLRTAADRTRGSGLRRLRDAEGSSRGTPGRPITLVCSDRHRLRCRETHPSRPREPVYAGAPGRG